MLASDRVRRCVMSGETVTLPLPAPLADELGSATQEFLADLLERGLPEVRVERALERYAHGGMSFGAAVRACPEPAEGWKPLLGPPHGW
jgi:hypothetical protein